MSLYPELATPKQQELLYSLLPHERRYDIPTLTKHKASELIRYYTENLPREAQPRPTRAQEQFLRDRRWWREGLTRQEASDLIGLARREDEARHCNPPCY